MHKFTIKNFVASATISFSFLFILSLSFQAFALDNTSSTSCLELRTTLQLNSSGADVITLQQFLISKGYLSVPSGVDLGYFGPLTKSAVIAFQKANGTSADGVVGPLTRGKIQVLTCTDGSNTGGSGSSNPSTGSGSDSNNNTSSAVQLKANGTSGSVNVSLGSAVALSWATTGQSSCYKSSTPASEFTGVLLPVASGSVTVYPTSAIQYKITCGSLTSSVSVNGGSGESAGGSGGSNVSLVPNGDTRYNACTNVGDSGKTPVCYNDLRIYKTNTNNQCGAIGETAMYSPETCCAGLERVDGVEVYQGSAMGGKGNPTLGTMCLPSCSVGTFRQINGDCGPVEVTTLNGLACIKEGQSSSPNLWVDPRQCCPGLGHNAISGDLNACVKIADKNYDLEASQHPGIILTAKLVTGDSISTTTTVNVRSSYGLDAPILTSVPAGTKGTLTGIPYYGPVVNGAYHVWWKVNYVNGIIGFSAEDYLQKIVNESSYVPSENNTSTDLTLTSGEPLTLSWSVSNVGSCLISGPGLNSEIGQGGTLYTFGSPSLTILPGSIAYPSGFSLVGNGTLNAVYSSLGSTYNLTCLNQDGSNMTTKSITVKPTINTSDAVKVDIKAGINSYDYVDGPLKTPIEVADWPVTLAFSASNLPAGASCKLNFPYNNFLSDPYPTYTSTYAGQSTNGSIFSYFSLGVGSQFFPSTSGTTYTLTCKDSSGVTLGSDSVEIVKGAGGTRSVLQPAPSTSSSISQTFKANGVSAH